MEKPLIHLKFIILLVLIPFYGYSQINTTDSLNNLLNSKTLADTSKIRIYLELSEATRKQNIDTALYYAIEATRLAEDIDNIYWLAYSNKQAGRIYFYKQNYSEALKHYDFSINYFQKVNREHEDYFKVMLFKSKIYAKTGKQKEALEINFKVAHKTDSLKLFIVKARAINHVSDVYRLQRDGPKALKYGKLAYNIADSIDDSYSKFLASHNLALVYDLNGDAEKGIEILKSCFRYNEFFSKDDSARIYSNIGRIYVENGNYVEGEKYLFKSLHLRKNLDVPFSLSHLYNEIATLYLYQNMYTKAVYYGEKSYAIAKKLENIRLLEDITRNLSDAYLGLKNYKEANLKRREYSDHLQYLFKKDKVEAIAEMETRYETAEKEKEIAILEGNEMLARRTKNSLILGLILLTVISALIILLLRLRVKKKAAEVVLANTKLEVSLKELENKQLQLDNFANTIREKNKMLEEITAKNNAGEIDVDFNKLEKLANSIILTEEDWQNFQQVFEQVHDNFYTRLRHKLPDITPSEKRLISLMKLNLSNKEISNMLGISASSVIKTKYRLKKKLSIQETQDLEMAVAEI